MSAEDGKKSAAGTLFWYSTFIPAAPFYALRYRAQTGTFKGFWKAYEQVGEAVMHGVIAKNPVEGLGQMVEGGAEAAGEAAKKIINTPAAKYVANVAGLFAIGGLSLLVYRLTRK